MKLAIRIVVPVIALACGAFAFTHTNKILPAPAELVSIGTEFGGLPPCGPFPLPSCPCCLTAKGKSHSK